jgi:hypothetical protein
MVFADGFWAIKSIVDWFTLVGGILALVSIWLSVYFARRDLQRTIEAARKDAQLALERFAIAFLQRELSELNRRFREARDAIRRKEWARAGYQLDDAEMRLVAALEDTRLAAHEWDHLSRIADSLIVLRKSVGKLETASGGKGLAQARQDSLDEMIRRAMQVESAIRHRSMETDDERTANATPPPIPRTDATRDRDVGDSGGG